MCWNQRLSVLIFVKSANSLYSMALLATVKMFSILTIHFSSWKYEMQLQKGFDSIDLTWILQKSVFSSFPSSFAFCWEVKNWWKRDLVLCRKLAVIISDRRFRRQTTKNNLICQKGFFILNGWLISLTFICTGPKYGFWQDYTSYSEIIDCFQVEYFLKKNSKASKHDNFAGFGRFNSTTTSM